MTLAPPPDALLDGASLFLDFDGTLVEFAERPDAVTVDKGLRDLLARLDRRLGGRLAIVSGRSLADLAALVGIEGIALAGSHGLEYRLPGTGARAPAPPDGLDEVIEQVVAFARRRDLLVEPKPAGVALHFRTRPELAGEAHAFADELARAHGLSVRSGSMVVELRAPGPDKGSIVRRFMAEPVFAAGRPVAVGDDLTDEDAFEAALALGGSAVLVGPRRSSAAQFRLPGVEATRDWLARAP